MALEDARDDERGPHDRSASLAPYSGKEVRRGRGPRVRAFLRVVSDRVLDLAPRLPVRDLETLEKQFPGLGAEEIADRLIAGATKSAATVGAGVGAAAMLPVPPAMPAELAAEIVGVASVELKLIAELHEVYGRRPPGNARQRSFAYLNAWTAERGVDIVNPASFQAVSGGHLRRRLRHQIMKRTVRNFPNLAPFLIGAVVGAALNRRETAKLAAKVRADLRDGLRDG